jgi:hypothetical protein
MPFIKRLPKSVGIAVAVVLAIGCVALVSATKGPYSPLEKAFYLDEKTVNFVRPGLVIRILSAEIAADGTARARVRFTDPRGLPLDRAGVTTPGTIGTSMVLATIPRGEKHYRSYTVRTQTSPINGRSAIQAAADTGGTWILAAEGEYTYTAPPPIPSPPTATATSMSSTSASIAPTPLSTSSPMAPASPTSATSSAPPPATSATTSYPPTVPAAASPWKSA